MLIDFVLNISLTISGIYLFHRIQYNEDSAKLSSPMFHATLMITLAVLLLLVPIDYRGYTFSLFFVPMLLIRSKIYIKLAGMVIVAALHYIMIEHGLMEMLIFSVLYVLTILIIPFFRAVNTYMMTWINLIFTLLFLAGIHLFIQPLDLMTFILIAFMSSTVMVTASVMYQDIHSIVRVLNRLNMEEYVDHLTQLGNVKALDNEVNRLNQKADTISLLLIDIDNFKLINDMHDHTAGDAVIRQITGLLKNYVPTGGSIYRNGGEEFAMVISDISFDRTVRLSEAIRTSVENTNFHVGENEIIQLTVSIGVGYKDQEASRKDLFKDADNMLHAAKKMGQNQVMFLPVIK